MDPEDRKEYTETIMGLPFSKGIGRLKKEIMEEERFLSVEQALLITESYRNTEGKPQILRRADALAFSLENIAIKITPGELIVGNRTAGARAGVVFPEAGISWLLREIDTLPDRPQDKFSVRQEDKKLLREVIVPYWKGKTLEDRIMDTMGTEIARIAKVVKINQKDHAQGHIIPDAAAWLRDGPSGIAARAEEMRKNCSMQSADFYTAAAGTLRAACRFFLRYADLADETASTAVPSDRQELAEISRICRKLAAAPPESFHEALQSVWFLFVLLQMESNASSFSPGRLDQYLHPYLLDDLKNGVLSPERALELIESLWLNFNKIVYLRNAESAEYFAGFPIGFNVVLGGLKRDGSDASNMLSFFCLKAQEHLGLPQPNLSVRLYKNSPDDLVGFCTRVIGGGSGMPQIFNDESVIPALEKAGVVHDDAADYAVVGCVELSTQGNNLGWSDAAMFNLVKALELALNNGVCLLTGEKIGPGTGTLPDYSTYEDLEGAIGTQIEYFIEKMIPACAAVDRMHAEVLPSPFLSSVIRDCMEKGLDVTAGGAHYNLSGIQAIQAANIADSLAVIKKMIYETSSMEADTLLHALRNNWEGYEILRSRAINQVPKYGNDVPWVDEIGMKWVDFFSGRLKSYTNARGGIYHTGLYTVSAHVPMGKNVGASADGRFAGTPLADGGISAMYGRDRCGPTALVRSVSRINSSLASNGTLLNMKFLPEFFKTEGDRKKFSAFLKAFVRHNIHHIQFNVVRKEDLIAARKDPDSYRGLTVRVAGYTAYFTELAADLQEEIIARTSYGSTNSEG